MNQKIQKQIKEIKALSSLTPKDRRPALNTIIDLYENGYFTNIKTALNLANGLHGSGTSQIKTLEKISQLQSQVIKNQEKIIFKPVISVEGQALPVPVPFKLTTVKPSDKPKVKQILKPKKNTSPQLSPEQVAERVRNAKAKQLKKSTPVIPITPVVLQQFFITADVTVEIMWSSSSRSGKTYTVKPSDVKNKTESDNYKTFEARPLEIFATSEAEAISKYNDAIVDTLDTADYERISKVRSLQNVQSVNMSSGEVTHPKDILMKASSHISYNFIPSDDSLLEKNIVLDMCVPFQFVGIYGSLIKKLTDDYFIDLCYQVRGEVSTPKSNIQQSRLDVDLCDEDEDGEPIVHAKQWTIKDGVSPDMLCKICNILNISHYAYDFSNNCFLKNIATSRNYPVLCYYALSGHMYLVSNKEKIKSMVEKSKSIETRINSSTLVRDLSKDEEKEDIFMRPIFENIEIKDLMNLDKCTIIYAHTELNGFLDEIIAIYNFIPIIFNHQQDIIKIHFTFQDKDIFLVADPNIDHTKEVQKMNWKTIQSYCIKLKLQFTNQSFSGLISQLKARFLDSKVKRHKFSKNERAEHHMLAGGVCNICYVEVTDKEFELDHVIPIASGGTNDDDNIVVLCRGCHADKTKCEKTETGYVKLSNTESSFNKITKEIFNSSLCGAYAFVEKRADPKKIGSKVFHIDINKSRKNNMLFSNYDYPLFTVMDSVVPYEGQTSAGYYYIESDSYFPIRCNGWYLFPTIDYCIKQKIIKSADIKYTIQASLTISPEHYNEFISYLYTNMGEFAKLGVNSMIGCFKMKAREHWKSQQITDSLGEAKYVQISTSANEALKKFIDLQGSVITTRCINDKKYYQVYNKYLSERDETEAIIYQQIVEVEAIELHKLSKIVEAHGGQVLDLNTDCVSCCFKNDILPFKTIEGSSNIEGFYWNDVDMVIPSWLFSGSTSDNIAIPKYKLEDKDHRLEVERMNNYKRTDKYVHTASSWNIIPDVLDNNFAPLVDQIVANNLSANIDGRAGVGKSKLISDIQARLINLGKRVISTAPTNKASNHIGGKTIHKFCLEFKSKKSIKDLKCDYLIVDEVSMLSECFYKYLITLKHQRPDIRFLMVGDYAQLQPVCDRVEEDTNKMMGKIIKYKVINKRLIPVRDLKGNCDYKASGALYELCDGNRIELTTCRRANNEMFEICKDVNSVDVSKFGSKIFKCNLSYTNVKRMSINKKLMDEAEKEKAGKHKALLLEALSYDPNSQAVKLLPNTPIIARVKNGSFNLVNNQMGKVTKIDWENETVNIKMEGEKTEVIFVNFDEFTKLFYVAYCITIHKSQGQTYNQSYTIHEWEMLDDRLKYVAISRATQKKFINIM